MKTSKAITILKGCLLHYQLLNKLYSIGLSPDAYCPNITEVGTAIFDWDKNRNDIDDVVNIFFKHGDALESKHVDMIAPIPDDMLTDAAMDLYLDWHQFNTRKTTTV